MKQIVCLATSPWYPIPTRKQQVMSRLHDAEILYFDPSISVIAPLKDKSASEKLQAWKQPGEQVKDNITVYALPPVWPAFNKYRWINRRNQKKMAAYVRKVMARHGFENPVLWTYSPVCADLVDYVPHSALVYDCVDRHSAYGGLMNLIASWLGDEGFYLDTEGDLGHTFIINTLNQLAGGGVVALGEAGSIDSERNLVPIAHEGSTPMSLADSLDRAQINPSGELGTFVGVPHKAMDTVTTCAIVGNGGNYKVFIAKGRTLDVTHEEWVEGGSKLLVNLQYDVPARSVVDQLIKGGMDHHFVIKEGDYTKEMEALCDYLGFDVLKLS